MAEIVRLGWGPARGTGLNVNAGKTSQRRTGSSDFWGRQGQPAAPAEWLNGNFISKQTRLDI
jgi:hypothetical protein